MRFADDRSEDRANTMLSIERKGQLARYGAPFMDFGLRTQGDNKRLLKQQSRECAGKRAR